MYNVYQSEQLIIFLASLGVGFILGILYDFLRALRLSLTQGKWGVIIFDLLYFFLVAFGSYLFILASNKGEVRSYIILGELLGAVFYYFSLGLALMKLTDKFVLLFKRFCSFVFRAFLLPFHLLKRVAFKVFGKIKEFFQKNKKKSAKIQKKVLPKARIYVYNLFGILCVGSKKSLKGGKADGRSEKEKST